jgi:hypothetical protein
VRSALLAAGVEIMLAGKEIRAARRAADELAMIARELNAPMMLAISAQATGSVLLA